MFGNTLAFSKLPLRDILSTQKDIMNNFLTIANDIYKFACQLNSDQQYKWHKNLQMTENELLRLRFHIEKAVAIINSIESDHLDYEAQMRRLRDVTARFQPLMYRIDCNLGGIQSELGLPCSMPGASASAPALGGGPARLAITGGSLGSTKSDMPLMIDNGDGNESTEKRTSKDSFPSLPIPAKGIANPIAEDKPPRRGQFAIDTESKGMISSSRVEELPEESSPADIVSPEVYADKLKEKKETIDAKRVEAKYDVKKGLDNDGNMNGLYEGDVAGSNVCIVS